MTSRQVRVLRAIQALEERSPTLEIRPRELWESARDPEHPLHGEFEWNNEIAGDLYRDDQARRLLRIRVQVTYEDRVIDAPICVRTPDAEKNAPSYSLTVRMLDDEDRSRKVLLDEIDRAARALERARLVASALGLSTECEELVSQLSLLRKRAA